MGKTYSWSDIVKQYDVPTEVPSTAAFAVVDGVLALPVENQRAVWLEVVERLLTTAHRNNVRTNTEKPILDDIYASGDIAAPEGWKPPKTRVRRPVVTAGVIPTATKTVNRYERWTKLDPLDGFETSKFGWVLHLDATVEEWECRKADQLKRQRDFQPSIDLCTVAIHDLKRTGAKNLRELLEGRGGA